MDDYPSSIFKETLEEKKNELEEIRKDYVNGLLVRARAKWIEDGEKPSKYFCNLEKRNFVNKNISKIITTSNKVITEQKELLGEIKRFYETLYSNRDEYLEDVNLNLLLQNCECVKITNDIKSNLENDITLAEISNALKLMKNEKSPGPDGYTAEFFKFFWNDLKIFLHRSYLESIQIGKLSITQRQGMISILPKGNKPREFLKNWRPISLLNITYKILSGAVAKRLKNTLNDLIHENQKGFLPGRFIGENIRILYDLMQYTDENHIPGLLTLIDFEKAFDSLSWNFIDKTLDFFNFGPNFKYYVTLFIHRETKLCVTQYGTSSDLFKIGRGCKQGDPISPYLFILCAEILGYLIRNNPEIKGLKIGIHEYKLFQYADDTALILDGSEKSLKKTFDLLDQFAKYSGLKPNIDKTSCVWIGSKKNSSEILCREHNLKWTNDPFVFLGITFSTNIEQIVHLKLHRKLN